MLGPLGLGLGVFTFVFLVGQLYRLLDLLLTSGVPARLVLELIASLLPGILSVTVPMALLVAILLGVGRLAADREILAIRMSGVNLMHICAPILGLAGVLSITMIASNYQLVPHLNLRATDLATQIEFQVLSAIPPDRFYDLDSGGGGMSSVFFYDHRDPQTGEMVGVNIKARMRSEEPKSVTDKRRALGRQLEEIGKKKDPESLAKVRRIRENLRRIEDENKNNDNEFLITGSRGIIEGNIAERILAIRLTNGSVHFASPNRPTAYNVVQFDTMTKGIRPRFNRTEEGTYRKSSREMAVPELRQMMANRDKRLARPAKVEFYQRFSIPLACIAFALIAIPLGVYARPTGKAVAFAISFLLIFAYYGLLNYGISLGKTGSNFAPFAIFFPNILLSLVGSFLLYRMVMK